MLDTRWRRVVAVGLLGAVLLALVVGFGISTRTPDPRANHFLDAGDLATDPAVHVGERAQVSGTVVDTDPVVVRARYSTWVDGAYRIGTTELTVTGLDRSVTEGQRLQVYGTVREDDTVHAEDSLVVQPTHYLYMYVVSFLAGLWVLARLVSGWTVSWEDLAVRPRPRPMGLRERVTDRRPGREDADA